MLDIMKFSKARSVLFLLQERLYILLSNQTMIGRSGIGNLEKFEFKNTSLSESSKTDFKDSTNKVFDLTL